MHEPLRKHAADRGLSTSSAALPLILLTLLAVLVLHGYALARPHISVDDFQMLAESWTWADTWNNVWLPANEHAMPLGRLTTGVLTHLAWRPTRLPFAAELQGVIAVLLGVPLVYLFVRRELGHPFYGVIAAALYGVTAVYQEAVTWFAASFSVLALDTLMLALLACQSWRRTGHWRHLVLAVLWCALAPGWFASGILAGPLCVVYLLPSLVPGRDGKDQKDRREGEGESLSVLGKLRLLLVAMLPLAGSVLFLAVSLPRTANHIMHLEHYDGKTALEAFNPGVGVVRTGRAVVDGVLLGSLGLGGISLPEWAAGIMWTAFVLFAGWWFWRAPSRRLVLLGLAVMLSSYLLTHSARADWSYRQLVGSNRYHLLPQLGWVLFLCGGLQRWELPADGSLTRRQWLGLALLVGVLLFWQMPHALGHLWKRYDPDQMAALAEVEQMDAVCREHGIDRATAVEALDWLEIPGAAHRKNGWLFLRGSPEPKAVTVEQAREILTRER